MADISQTSPSLAQADLTSRGPGARPRLAAAVHIFAAALLIAAALLKAYQIARGASALTGMPGAMWSRALDLIEIEFELALGAILLLRIWPEVGWWLAILAYTVFAVASVRKVTEGVTTCGCFGPVTVHPGVMVAVDIAVVLMLLFAGPVPRRNENRAARSRFSLIARRRWRISAIALLLLLMLSSAAAVGFAAIPKRGLVASERGYYNLGVVPIEQAAHCTHIFTVQNTSARPVRILGSNKSCGCTLVETPDAPIAPGRSADVRVVADWSKRAGRVVVLITLDTDSLWTPRVPLILTAQIKPPPATLPAQ